MRWLVAGGGTGGHVTPALALAERIAARGDRVLLLGSEHGLETRLVPDAGFELKALPSRQVMGQGLAGRVAAVIAMLRATAQARRALRTFGPQVVVSVGGYASVPAVTAAVLARLPVALVEPNAIPGRANRLAARFAKRIFVQFEQSGRIFGRSIDPARILATGIPLRTSLIESFADAPPRSRASGPLRVLVFGGSQGARQINEAMMEAARTLEPAAYRIFHQSGEADRDRVEAAYSAAGLDAEVVAFEPEMPKRYRQADVAVCRSGALTVAELALAALPALLIPYPYAADDHQTANAAALRDSGAAKLLDPAALSGALLVEELESLRRAPERLHEMSGRAAKLAHPDAAERIVEECAALACPGGGD